MYSYSHPGEAKRLPLRHAVRRRHSRLSMAALAVALISGTTQPAAAQSPLPAPLTFEAALQAAEMHSAGLRAQDASATAFREQAVAAGRLPDPELRLSLDNVPAEGPMRFSLDDDFMTMQSVGLSQTFTDADKRLARRNRFEREADAAVANRRLQLATLRTQTARAWLARHYQQQLLELLEQQRKEAVLVVEAVEAGYRGGSATQSELFLTRAAVARLDDRLREARAGLNNADSLLSRWVGDDATTTLGRLPDIRQVPGAAQAAAHEIEAHPQLALLDARTRVAEAEAEVARQEKSLDWTWSLRYSRRDDAFGDMVSLGVAIPLQWDRKNRQDRELAARLASVEQRRSEREEIRREHLFEVRRLWESWRSNLSRLDDYDHTLLPLTEARTQAAQAAYRGGKGALAAVLEARRMAVDTRIERLRIEMQTAALWAELAFLIPEEYALLAARDGQADQTTKEPTP